MIRGWGAAESNCAGGRRVGFTKVVDRDQDAFDCVTLEKLPRRPHQTCAGAPEMRMRTVAITSADVVSSTREHHEILFSISGGTARLPAAGLCRPRRRKSKRRRLLRLHRDLHQAKR